MATVASLLVKLGLDAKKFDSGVKKTLRGIDTLVSRLDRLDTVGKAAGLATAASALVSLTAAAQPAAGAILALPAAALVAAAGAATLAVGMSGMGDALAATSGTAAELDEALAKLAPSAQDFVRSIAGIRSAFAPVQQAVQQKLFAGLGEELSALAMGIMPTLRRGMTSVASALNSLGSEALRTMQAPLFRGQLAQIFDGTATATRGFSGVVGPLITILSQLAIAGLPLVQRFAEWAAGASASGAAFLTSEAGAARLASIVERAGDVLGQLGAIAGNLGTALGGIFGAASVSGGSLLDTVEQLSARFAAWATSAEGQQQLATTFATLNQVATDLMAILPGIASVIGIIAGAFAALPPGVQGAVTQFLAWSIVLGAVSGKLAPLYGGIKLLSGGLLGIGKAIATPDSGLRKFAGTLGTLGTTAGKGLAKLGGVLGKIGIQALLMGARMLAGWIMGMGPIGWIIAAIIALVALVIIYWDEIVAAITAAWGWIKSATVAAWNGLIAWLSGIWTSIVTTATAAWASLKAAVVGLVMGIVTWVIGKFQMFVLRLQIAWTLMKLAAVVAWQQLKTAVIGLVMGVVNWVVDKVTTFAANLRAGWNAIKTAAANAWAALKARVISLVMGVVTWVVGKVLTFVARLKMAWLMAKIGAITAFTALKTAVTSRINQLVSFVRSIPGKIKQVFSNAKNFLLNAGKKIIQGLIDGVTNMIGRLRDKFSSVTDMIPDWKGPMSLDLKLLTPSGEALMTGLTRGIEDGLPALRSLLGQVTNEIPSNISTSAAVRHSGAQNTRVVIDVTGADGEFKRLIRKLVRIDGRGDVQTAFGT